MNEQTVTTSNNENVSHTEYDTGKILGLDVQFSKMLGDVIVENYMKQLSENDMKLITDYITSDLFEEVKDWGHKDDDGNYGVIRRVKESWEESGRWNREKKESTGDAIKKEFNKRVKEELNSKIEEIIASSDYQGKIEKMAQDIVDYVIDGYKEDLKNSIREKMIGNVMGNNQYYGGFDLKYIINQEIQNYLPGPNY